VSFEAFIDVVRQIQKYWLRLNIPPPPMRESSHVV